MVWILPASIPALHCVRLPMCLGYSARWIGIFRADPRAPASVERYAKRRDLIFVLAEVAVFAAARPRSARARSATRFTCKQIAVASATPCAIVRAVRYFAAFAALFCKVTEMLSINGTAMQRTQREFHRAAAGCPMISGSGLLAVAKNYRDFATELDR